MNETLGEHHRQSSILYIFKMLQVVKAVKGMGYTI